MNASLSAVASTLSSIPSFVAMSLFSLWIACVVLVSAFLKDFVILFSSRSLYVDGSSLKKLVVLSAAISSMGSFLMWSVSSTTIFTDSSKIPSSF